MAVTARRSLGAVTPPARVRKGQLAGPRSDEYEPRRTVRVAPVNGDRGVRARFDLRPYRPGHHDLAGDRAPVDVGPPARLFDGGQQRAGGRPDRHPPDDSAAGEIGLFREHLTGKPGWAPANRECSRAPVPSSMTTAAQTGRADGRLVSTAAEKRLKLPGDIATLSRAATSGTWPSPGTAMARHDPFFPPALETARRSAR